MKIHNVRLGLATNSSSSHSIVFDEFSEDAIRGVYTSLASALVRDTHV